MKGLICFLVAILLLASIVVAEMQRGQQTQVPSPPQVPPLETTEIPLEIGRIEEKVLEKGFTKCEKDEDCLFRLVCPMAIGMDTPMCVDGKCVCGPGKKIINKTKIMECWQIRERLKEIAEEVREEENTTKASEIASELVKVREEYSECFPQPVSPVAPIAIKYAIEKMETVDEFKSALENLREEMMNNITTQNLTGKEIAELVHEFNKERRELIKEFVNKIQEINLARIEEIKEVVVSKDVEFEREKLVNVTKITITVNNKTIEIYPGENVTISVEGVIVRSIIPLRVKNNSLEDAETNETIRETPEKIKERIKEEIKEMKLERKARIPVYSVDAIKPGRLLGIIPISFNIKYEIAATDGTTLATVKPWWSFLVFG